MGHSRGSRQEHRPAVERPRSHQVDIDRVRIELPDYHQVLELLMLAASHAAESGQPMEKSLEACRTEDGRRSRAR
jgi:hypothetical protein